MFRFSKPETPRAALFVFLRNETRAKSGFVSYVSIFLCFDFDPIYWSDGYDIWFRPQTFWVRFHLRAVGFPCCEICGTSPTLHILLRRTGTYCDLSGVATWYTLTKGHNRKKKKKGRVPKKKEKKTTSMGHASFPHHYRGFLLLLGLYYIFIVE